ncbi:MULTISPECIES: FAD-binding oxidoreductase [unclassified Carboxydocella]|uniref:FAD-binding oxidoreductase n=1 Tax=unclassified Carboxydocella TaxID=2685367 RepID=UPI0009CFE20C|nr:glycolate oxidase [Carboxydocella thermautotrophica]GAW29575.1 lactate dehydrogenase [Carboxydocella sp. ULO1]GAW32487.1 lactate dehydrogenase [Carboxydocella sp. JDF658]
MALAQQIQTEIIRMLGHEKVLTSPLELAYYSYDSSFLAREKSFLPDLVVFPTSTSEVAAIMKLAWQHEIPVTPRGAGTGETCGCVPVKGGIVLDLSRWKTIEEIDAANMQVWVRPGVIHAELNEALAPYGLFFPPDPGSTRMCTIGGMVANNSSGLRAVKYGATENYVLGLEVVLPNGEVIITGGTRSKAVKSVTGLNLTKVFVGSEGTLGVITNIRLRLWPKPKGRGIAMAVFANLEDAPAAVLDVYRAGILPSGIEIMDNSAIRAVSEFAPELNLPVDAQAILIFEVDGNPASVAWEGEQIQQIVGQRALRIEWATEPKRMADLWRARGVVATAAARVRPDGSRIFHGEDISVPFTQVTEALRRIQALGEEFGVKVVVYGHIGDGNLHTAPVIDPENPAEVEQAHRLADAIHRLAVELGGTTTGEHGVGLVRAPYARLEHGSALKAMWAVKKALDPKNIMNPGKVLLPEEES